MNLENPLERNIFFYTDVTQETIGEISAIIVEIESHDIRLKKHAAVFGLEYKPDPIKFYINTPGGDAYAVLGLIGIMRNCTTPIHTIATGCAMSAGFLMAISGHKRFCYESSSYMWHEVGYMVGGKTTEHEENMVETLRIQKIIDKNIIEKTLLTAKDLKKIYRTKQDKFISAEDALKLGIVDEIL